MTWCPGRWAMLGTGSMCHHRPPIGGDACYWLGWSPERGPNVEHSVRLAEGTEADRFEDTSGRTCHQWGRQPDFKELTEFHDSSGCLKSTLNAKRWNWRPPALHGPQGILCCHSQQMPLRCRSPGAWLYPFIVEGTFLVAWNDQPGAEVHRILHMLCTAWWQFDGDHPASGQEESLHPIVSTTPMDLLHI